MKIWELLSGLTLKEAVYKPWPGRYGDKLVRDPKTGMDVTIGPSKDPAFNNPVNNYYQQQVLRNVDRTDGTNHPSAWGKDEPVPTEKDWQNIRNRNSQEMAAAKNSPTGNAMMTAAYRASHMDDPVYTMPDGFQRVPLPGVDAPGIPRSAAPRQPPIADTSTLDPQTRTATAPTPASWGAQNYSGRVIQPSTGMDQGMILPTPQFGSNMPVIRPDASSMAGGSSQPKIIET